MMAIRTIQIGTHCLIQGECEIEKVRVFHSGMYDETGYGLITILGRTYRGRLLPQTWKPSASEQKRFAVKAVAPLGQKEV